MRNRSPRRPLPARILSLICLLAVACGPGEPAATEGSDGNQSGTAGGRGAESDADQIFAADEAFNRVTGELGAAGWVDFFAPDGRIVVNGEEITGKAAIREAMEPYLSAVRLEWSPTRAAARAGSDLGYTVGRYRATPKENPDSVIATGTYVTIWERQADGSWKVALDVGSEHPEPRP
jgi:ketosteroid isomerase-like protein